MNSNSTDPHPDAVKAAEELFGSVDEFTDHDIRLRADTITTATRLRERDECIAELAKALNEIRTMKPVRMGDHWAWEYGLKPDDVFDIIDAALAKAKGFTQ